jgi:hypothetical protein
MSQMPTKRKLQLVALFGGSIIPVGITLYRIPNIIDQKGDQVYRSLWASVEILLATGVANALILGSFVRDRGVKKQKFKYGSVTDSMDRTTSRRGTVARHWGSDEDLVRDLGRNPLCSTSTHGCSHQPYRSSRQNAQRRSSLALSFRKSQ